MIAVLCPSRGRPGAAAEALASFRATVGLADSRFVVVFDDDDPLRREYESRFDDWVTTPGGSMVAALNFAADLVLLEPDPPEVVGFIGDDHRFRTHDWDIAVVAALDEMGGGFVYGNDLARDDDLPTQVFISSRIILALGWMGLPTCRHLYIDNAWRTLGNAVGRFRHLPNVVIEHLHPAYGKAAWDDGHRRVNSAETYAHDGEAYGSWVEERLADDVARVQAVL